MGDWLNNNIADGSSFLDVDVDPSLLLLLPDVDVDVDSFLNDFSIPSPVYSAPPLSIGEIEHLLMKDDYHNIELPNHDSSDHFLSDLLLDSPGASNQSAAAGEGEVLYASDAHVSNSSGEENIDLLQPHHNDDDAGDADNPISKKRRRQLRNRDAAVRSRERKKMYVRDLELKSRYLEGECKRLGMLLQCCFAENQALRLSLQNTKVFDASMTKQESAVLLLESLLLGSLLWFLGIICLCILAGPLHSTLVAVPLENVGSENQGNLAPRKAGSRIFSLTVFQSVMMGKRCKASRSRMKGRCLEVLVRLS